MPTASEERCIKSITEVTHFIGDIARSSRSSLRSNAIRMGQLRRHNVLQHLTAMDVHANARLQWENSEHTVEQIKEKLMGHSSSSASFSAAFEHQLQSLRQSAKEVEKDVEDQEVSAQRCSVCVLYVGPKEGDKTWRCVCVGSLQTGFVALVESMETLIAEHEHELAHHSSQHKNRDDYVGSLQEEVGVHTHMCHFMELYGGWGDPCAFALPCVMRTHRWPN